MPAACFQNRITSVWFLWALTWNTFLDILVQNQSPYHSAFFILLCPSYTLSAKSSSQSHIISPGWQQQAAEWNGCRYRCSVRHVSFRRQSQLMPLNPINLWAEIEFPEQRGACGKTVDRGRRLSLLLRDFQTNIVGRLRVVLSTGRDVWPAVRKGLWLTSDECVTTRAKKRHRIWVKHTLCTISPLSFSLHI